MRKVISLNPSNGQILKEFEESSAQEVEVRIARAVGAFQKYKRVTMTERGRLLNRVAEVLESEKQQLARIMTLEMGKLLRASIEEVDKCVWNCRYYADKASSFLADETIVTEGGLGFVRFQPLGVVLAVMPWNFPLWQVFRFAAPALMAGNVVLLKHASNVPQCALAIENIFRRAEYPDGVFQTLLVMSDRVQALVEDARIKAVTLTGSVGAGRSLASCAGKQIKKTVLELGGSDPFITMPSADLDRAVTAAVRARTINNGQSCIAAKRFIVDRQICEEFVHRFVEQMSALKVGDPMLEQTDIGPLATAEVRDSLESQVSKTVQMGGTVLVGGKRRNNYGFFFEPTVLTDIPLNSPAQIEELFGPVASVFVVKGIEDAISVANDSPFGLGSCIWTNNKLEISYFIEEIQAGLAFVNGMVASDPRLPFGGIKESGYGRELSREGIREFVNIKTVRILEAAKPVSTE